MLYSIGTYQQVLNNIDPSAKGIRVIFKKLAEFPKGKCIKFGFIPDMPSTINGEDAWLTKEGKVSDITFMSQLWPGQALTDIDGNILCVPMTDKLVINDTPEARALAYPMSKEQIKASRDGIHAFIREEIKLVTATLYFEIFQEVDLDIVFESI